MYVSKFIGQMHYNPHTSTDDCKWEAYASRQYLMSLGDIFACISSETGRHVPGVIFYYPAGTG